MVLLTSSAISVAISSTVVCTFTFLLFLSGYVLQQQTVRSLQEALHRPPEPKPAVTLPQKFWQEDDGFDHERKQSRPSIIEVVQTSPESIEQRILDYVETQQIAGEDTSARPVFEMPEAASSPSPMQESSEKALSKTLAPHQTPAQEPRVAYILALSSPAQICSALLFFKWQRQFGIQRPSLILLYPSIWESDSGKPDHKAALDLMRDAQDTNKVVLHPVEISSVWEGITIENQLLGSLQRNWRAWGFDRSIYLRSPGLALDISKLDFALSKSSLKKSWMPLSSAPQDTPSVLLMSAERNAMMVPRGIMRGLTIGCRDGWTRRTSQQRDRDRSTAGKH